MRVPIVSCLFLAVAGCAPEGPARPDASTHDASAESRDAGDDGGPSEDGGPGGDAGAREDAGGGEDGGLDTGMDGGGADAAAPEDGGTCGAASTGHTLVFDGTDDLGEYPAAQILTPGATLETWERFALTWDPDYLYVTMVSRGFEEDYEPVHVYLEAAESLGAATPSAGKEYDSLVPELPFTPTHLIALRRVSDSGVGGPYNGLYTPAASWEDRALGLVDGIDYWAAADHHTLAARVPWSTLGCPSRLRITAHVVHGEVGNEWKDLVPVGATPWASGGGAYYEIDLGADPAITGWAEHTP